MLLGKSKKPAMMSDEDLKELDLKVVSMIQLCVADKVMYNVMDEETITNLWYKLKILYMMKCLSNRLKQQLYGLHMKKCTSILEHLNTFNNIITNLLSTDVKLDKDDNALILLNSLLSSYKHFVITILHGKETLTM